VYGLKVTGVLAMDVMNMFKAIGLNPVVAVTIFPAIGRTAVMDMYGLKVVGAANVSGK
jgi:hypothetical protein